EENGKTIVRVRTSMLRIRRPSRASAGVYTTNACARSATTKEDSRMKTTASDVLIDSIHDWGVDVVFRLPGDGINGIQDALRKEHSEVPNTDFPLRERIRASFDCESPSPVPVMPWFEVQ